MSDHIKVPNIFILDQCEVKRKVLDKETNTVKDVNYKIDHAKLQEIANLNNKRVAETGDKVPLIMGHTEDGKGDKEVVGYASNFEVKDFFATGKKGLSSTFEVFANCADQVRKFPRRSIELLMNSGKLTAIALLGGTQPERDLGLMQFSSEGPNLKFNYGIDLSSMNAPMTNLPKSNSPVGMDMVQQIIAALENCDVFVWAKDQMSKQKAVDAGMTKDLLPQEESDSDDLLGEEEVEEEDKPVDGKGSSEPTGKGTSDKEEEKAKMEAKDLEDIKIKLSSIEEANLKLKTEQEVLKVENAALKIQLQNAQRKDTILKLKAEGLGLDVEKELEYTKSFNDEQFEAHCEHAKLCYQKAPVGEAKFNFEKDSAAPQGELSGEEAHKIALKAAEEKISFSDALNKYKGKI